ncbi:hypothetical protein PR202_ga22267 [Eleusine coracana subsp. coracana]|uniref:Uncharacterized protein n=1 Tax=Eleusine coracana subsp. coracana TaxID=191504 RepID=A0AAV5D350_ELECO|nr:hypothetical protein PR202_ga22267 [Eleusine coracana subsp. coracana]
MELAEAYETEKKSSSMRPDQQGEKEEVVRLVGCDGKVRSYRPPVTARELMQQHPCHLVCRADALLIGEKIPAVAPAEELQPGQAYFLLPAHLFRSVLSFVSLASSLLLLLSSSSAAAAGQKGASKKQHKRPFELCRTASGTLQIKFSDDFLVGGADGEKEEEKKKEKAPQPAVLRGDERLEKEYEELVGYGKSRRWAPKLEPIQEVVVVVSPASPAASDASSSPTSASSSSERRKSRGIPFLGRLGSRRRRDASSSAAAALSCNGAGAVACSG